MRGKPPKPEKVAELESRMNDCIDIIENVWLKDKPFLTGNTISVADIFCACELEQPRKLFDFSISGIMLYIVYMIWVTRNCFLV